ncbi:xylulokinase [Vibrio nigripulchritudo]|uniref:xylulokinase n=1 Tax=Vibrio nigripulchritudo TaxID=28173 RepID=UPI0003B1EE27|nr:xylulokinase [Vibrio nigripulchritudo]CCN69272.1 xylulokinase [Vibrio nigripulchritudo SFn118]
MYIGIDLGTSSVKVILLDSNDNVIASQAETLEVSRPNEMWSEQDPNSWWESTVRALSILQQKQSLREVKAIGLSGQMHGATLLDSNGNVLRPAILWNDGRSIEECVELEELVPSSRTITGNIMMPGFTAPKLKWVQKHEPDVFAKIHKVLLPKDFIRLKLSDVYASDMSDSAGSMWLDVEKRDWNDELLSACGLTREHMPLLFEGCNITSSLKQELAERWGMECVPIVAGAGDNAAGAVGGGIIEPGQAMLSLGTSGVYFAASDSFISNSEYALHSFCHALPKKWHVMSVILSAASCLEWVTQLTGKSSVGEMLRDIEKNSDSESQVIFLPYLAGERTPHNNPKAKGVFFGMTHETTKADLGLAVLEGVGFAFADGLDALPATMLEPREISLIGGGAKSPYWRQMLADILGKKIAYRLGGEVGPALGAARLARLGTEPDATTKGVCPVPALIELHKPNIDLYEKYREKRAIYQQLYKSTKGLFNR